MRAFLSACLVAAFVGLGSPPPEAQGQAALPRLSPMRAPGSPAASSARATTVFGFVWNARNDPIPHAAVQLRNVTTGYIEARAVAAANGEFTFDNLEGGTYVIEYVDEQGKILAVGHVFSVSPGETVATFIRLGSRVRWFAALLGSAGNAAATAVSSAASLGVTALGPRRRPVSPEG
jgi:hypothetical protein